MNSLPLARKGLDILRKLLVRPDRLGDLVLTTPVLHALRVALPHAHITMMVGPGMREVVERHPDVDSVLTCSFPGIRGPDKKSLKPLLLMSAARHLRASQYDLAISLLDKSWWSAALLYLARIPRATTLSGPFLSHAGSPQSHEHITASCLHLISTGLRALGYPALAEPYLPDRYPLYLVPTPQERQWVERHLLAEGIDASLFGPWASPDRHPIVISKHRCAGCRSLPRGHLDFEPRSCGTTSWMGCPAKKRVQAQKRAG